MPKGVQDSAEGAWISALLSALTHAHPEVAPSLFDEWVRWAGPDDFAEAGVDAASLSAEMHRNAVSDRARARDLFRAWVESSVLQGSASLE